jgi:hypothetical protein
MAFEGVTTTIAIHTLNLVLLQVMGAQHLPKRAGSDDIPSPFCSVIVYGDPADSAKHKTRVVPENGFNPVRISSL